MDLSEKFTLKYIISGIIGCIKLQKNTRSENPLESTELLFSELLFHNATNDEMIEVSKTFHLLQQNNSFARITADDFFHTLLFVYRNHRNAFVPFLLCVRTHYFLKLPIHQPNVYADFLVTTRHLVEQNCRCLQDFFFSFGGIIDPMLSEDTSSSPPTDIATYFLKSTRALASSAYSESLQDFFFSFGSINGYLLEASEHEYFDPTILLEYLKSIRISSNRNNVTNDFRSLFFAFKRCLQDAQLTNSYLLQILKLVRTEESFNLDAFSHGQIQSKLELIKGLSQVRQSCPIVFLMGGWYGILTPLLYGQTPLQPKHVFSFDIDPLANKIAEKLNVDFVKDNWKFKTSLTDIHKLSYELTEFEVIKHNGDKDKLQFSADLIMNTSCEHLSGFSNWWNSLPNGQLVALQSNNLSQIEEHINCVDSLGHFKSQAPMQEIIYESELFLEDYTRFTLIGRK